MRVGSLPASDEDPVASFCVAMFMPGQRQAAALMMDGTTNCQEPSPRAPGAGVKA